MYLSLYISLDKIRCQRGEIQDFMLKIKGFLK